MTEVLGPHLLGRVPSPPDERDFKLANFLGLGVEAGPQDPIELIALGEAELKLTTVTFKKWAATSYPDVTKTHWWKAFNYFELAKFYLTPPPPPPNGGFVEWEDPQPILDQQDTNHCVGFSGAQWGNTLPINDLYTNRDGHAIYYEAKVFDGEPNQENGSTMRSLAKTLKARGRLTVYAFATEVADAVAWIKEKGPVMVGTDWTDNMFEADSNGLVHATGPVVGGHAYVMNGYDGELDQLLYINSWGSGWANDGHFRLSVADAEEIHADYGELLVAVELPIG